MFSSRFWMAWDKVHVVHQYHVHLNSLSYHFLNHVWIHLVPNTDNTSSLLHTKTIRMQTNQSFPFLTNFLLFRNLFFDDGKSKDNKTPEPPYIGDDNDAKDGAGKSRRSRSDRDSMPSKRKTSAGAGGSSESKPASRGASKGGSRYGKQSPTLHSSDGQDGTSESSLEKSMPKIIRFRWIIPANSEIRMRLRFVSSEVGQFDQTVQFEIMGTKRNYKVFCRGVCTFPAISREPRFVIISMKQSPYEFLVELFFLIDRKHVSPAKSCIRNSFFQLNNTISVR